MKKLQHVLFAVFILLFILQSCKKDIPFDPFNKDKLLISKVSGKFESEILWGPNGHAYDNDGNLLKEFEYGPATNWLSFRPLQKIHFISEGSFDFLYDGWQPQKVIDNSLAFSFPPYWRFYYDVKGRIEKMELHPHEAGAPSEYEFYSYNHKDQLVSFIYGSAIDTPSFKVEYTYDQTGNIKTFEYYVPVDTGANGVTARNRAGLLQPLVKKGGLPFESKWMSPMKNKSRETSATSGSPAYSLLLSARITTDHRINPYSQQDHILFYLGNRNAGVHLNPYFMGLLRSNPVKVEYEINPALGSFNGATIFNYTYNSDGYPISVHEQAIDPDFVSLGDYTEDSRIEYIGR